MKSCCKCPQVWTVANWEPMVLYIHRFPKNANTFTKVWSQFRVSNLYLCGGLVGYKTTSNVKHHMTELKANALARKVRNEPHRFEFPLCPPSLCSGSRMWLFTCKVLLTPRTAWKGWITRTAREGWEGWPTWTCGAYRRSVWHIIPIPVFEYRNMSKLAQC